MEINLTRFAILLLAARGACVLHQPPELAAAGATAEATPISRWPATTVWGAAFS
jgi:hypothetical protein